MDDERIAGRLAASLGLRREDVRCVVREKKDSCYHAVALLFPAECSETSHTLANAINDALNIEAGLGNVALLDLFGARKHRFSREAGWYEKIRALCNSRYIDKKYHHSTRELAFSGAAAEGEQSLVRRDQTAVIVITSCHRDGKPLLRSRHNANRALAIVDALEKHEDALRAIVRHAAPSHHLLAAPRHLAPESVAPMPGKTHPVSPRKAHALFEMSQEPSYIEISV